MANFTEWNAQIAELVGEHLKEMHPVAIAAGNEGTTHGIALGNPNFALAFTSRKHQGTFGVHATPAVRLVTGSSKIPGTTFSGQIGEPVVMSNATGRTYPCIQTVEDKYIDLDPDLRAIVDGARAALAAATGTAMAACSKDEMAEFLEFKAWKAAMAAAK